MQFFHGTNIDFVGIRKQFFIVSLIVTIGGLIATGILGIEYGIDFVGGTEIALQVNKPVHTDVIRKAVTKAGVSSEEVKSYGKDNQYLIRIKESGAAANKVEEALKTNLADDGVTILKKDTIGPKIGKELRTQALWAVLLSVVAMLIYIGFRFEFVYGMGAIVALVHDVVFTFGIIVTVGHTGLINLEMSQGILAAMLTVVGYSVNDTVIIFDRIRENLTKHKGMNFIKLVNMSVNETLSRTINTVMTVVLVLLTMVLLAGPVLQGFAFTMLIGIVVGTYSSIYIASSFVIFYLQHVKKVKFEDADDRKKVAVSAKA
jgi:preprotein translocase subunit SecF